MEIWKVLNNNVAVIRSEDQSEIIVTGKGICFKKRPGDKIDSTLVEKEFILKDDKVRERFQMLASEVSLSCMKISEQIIKRAKEGLGKRLNENIYVSLTDHIQFALDRFDKGLVMKNDMLWDIKRMYPEEYRLGKEAIDMVKEELNITLPRDECAFVALHIISAELNEQVATVMSITKIVPDILNIIKYHFNIYLNEDSLSYYRLVTHLKFFAQRVANGNLYDDSTDDMLFQTVKNKYWNSYACTEKIGAYINNEFSYVITNEEALYLTVHIERILADERENPSV